MSAPDLPAHVEHELGRLAAMATDVDRHDPDDVARTVYASWYLGVPDVRVAAPADEAAAAALGSEQRRVVSLLRAAHADDACFEGGWVVLDTDGCASVVARDGEQRVVLAGDLANRRGAGVPVHPGDEVAVVRRRDSVHAETGYWVARSPAGDPDGPLGRLYLDVTLDTVAPVLRLLTASLGALDGVAWSLKCPTDPRAFERVDTVVAYVPVAEEAAARAVAATILAEAGASLVAAVPPLTDPIGPGVAWAEDPGTDDSFGMHRCRALAPTVQRIASNREPRPPVAALVTALAEAGIDPGAPWRATREGAAVR